MQKTTIQSLFEQTREHCALHWVDPRIGGARTVQSMTDYPSIGHLSLINPNQIQVLGHRELDYIMRLTTSGMRQAVKAMFIESLAAIIIASGYPPPESVVRLAKKHQIALFTSTLPTAQLVEELRHHLSLSLAETTSLHGVFMEVKGMGVLITGNSAIGKSELALELISRNHRLVADDIVDLYHVAPGTIEGRCPPLLQDFLEVRGLGLLNIRALFGETAVSPKKTLRLIVHLEHFNDIGALDRLQMAASTQNIMGVDVPKVRIPVHAGTNIAVLLEVAVRNHILHLRGIDSTQEFIERQQREIARGQKG